ncbi:hypothetical protein 10S9_60 [uncultured Caudovirales phage]|uniref:Uncharacterized protein n=1 Tax=uncultured Caudovirales phage TaxID=2100421 RepID=A0A2H4J4Z2_9CAUD|nr:hypothetical protein 10S9_60 [uncultured Caudovirales phage]
MINFDNLIALLEEEKMFLNDNDILFIYLIIMEIINSKENN